MSTHNEYQESPLQSPLLFSSAEELPLGLLQSVIEEDLFETPLGSHRALHNLYEELKKENLQPWIRKAIESTLRSPSLRQKIYTSWSLWPDSTHAENARDSMDGLAPLDLASWVSKNCSGCFDLLLGYQAVSPASFCRAGYGFFILAYMGRRDILGPFSFNPGDPIMSVFQVSTFWRRVFQACWARLKPLPDNGLKSLKPAEIERIFRFADPSLAKDLEDSGLELAEPSSRNMSSAWYGAAARNAPVTMLNWLLSRAELPEDLLATAAHNNYIHAAPWIVQHTQSYVGWRKGAQEAADCLARGSAKMLAIILQSPFAKGQTHQTLLEDLTIIAVDRACQDGKSLRIEGPDDPRRYRLDDVEDVAVQKVKVLQKESANVEVVGLRVKAAELGMYRLEAALGEADGGADANLV
ncbi:unnamed protein product [Penicillium manginii]